MYSDIFTVEKYPQREIIGYYLHMIWAIDIRHLIWSTLFVCIFFALFLYSTLFALPSLKNHRRGYNPDCDFWLYIYYCSQHCHISWFSAPCFHWICLFLITTLFIRVCSSYKNQWSGLEGKEDGNSYLKRRVQLKSPSTREKSLQFCSFLTILCEIFY